MAFNQKDAASDVVNYKSMGKSELIMLVQTQKSDIEFLNNRLSETKALSDERNRLAQQVAELSAEVENLRQKAEQNEQKLSAAEPEIKEVGSIAELSFRVNGVMEVAQKAADDYLAKIKEMYDAMSRDYSVYEINAKQKADAILKSANEEATAMTQEAREEVNNIWSALQIRFDNYVAGKKQTDDK